MSVSVLLLYCFAIYSVILYSLFFTIILYVYRHLIFLNVFSLGSFLYFYIYLSHCISPMVSQS